MGLGSSRGGWGGEELLCDVVRRGTYIRTAEALGQTKASSGTGIWRQASVIDHIQYMNRQAVEMVY